MNDRMKEFDEVAKESREVDINTLKMERGIFQCPCSYGICDECPIVTKQGNVSESEK